MLSPFFISLAAIGFLVKGDVNLSDLIVCPSNEEMSPCGKQYEKNCTNAKWKRPPTTVRICGSHIQDCTCKEGHVRHEGNCIPYEECPTEARHELHCNSENEVENECGNSTDNLCQVQFFSSTILRFPRECVDPPACICKEGMYRHNQVCISRAQCEEVVCPNHQQINACGNLCEKKCHQVIESRNRTQPISYPCPMICGPAACTCLNGFARTEAGVCVEEAQC